MKSNSCETSVTALPHTAIQSSIKDKNMLCDFGWYYVIVYEFTLFLSTYFFSLFYFSCQYWQTPQCNNVFHFSVDVPFVDVIFAVLSIRFLMPRCVFLQPFVQGASEPKKKQKKVNEFNINHFHFDINILQCL